MALPILQGSSLSLQGSSPSVQGSSPNLQPTYNPQPGGAGFATAGGGTSGGQAPSVGGYSGPSAAELQAQQEAEGLRNEIIARRQRANQIFDALTGAVSALAQERRGQLEGQFVDEQNQATSEFGKQSLSLRRGYNARGLGDSSFKGDALEDAGEKFNYAIGQLGRGREKGLADIAGQATAANARIGADKGSISDIERAMNESGDNPGVLRDLRNQLDNKIRELEVKEAELQTEGGLRGQLGKIAPYAGVNQALTQALTNLVRVAAPQAVKNKIAETIIGNFAPDDQNYWRDFYAKQEQSQDSPTKVEE